MFRRYITISILLITLIMAPMRGEAASSKIDKSQLSSGIVTISFESKLTVAVRIEKGKEKKDHILGGNNSFTLQFGQGKYTVTVLENAEGNKFRVVERQEVEYKTENENDIYLQSIQGINWNKDMKSIKKAKELTKNSKTTMEKVTIIYNHIINNVKYDNNLAVNIKPGYISTIDSTLLEGKGICYDYSALFAGMTRSLDIPTKLVEGRKNDIEDYHAWNEVYIEETGQWILVDTTYDAGLKIGQAPTTMIKDVKEYKVEKVY